MSGKLAVELAEQGHTIGKPKLGACRGKRRVLRWRRAIYDDARARKRVEDGGERGIADPVVRPGNARAR